MRTISMIVLSSVMFVLHLMLAPVLEIFTAKIDFIMISVLLLAVFSKKWYPPVICGVYSGLALDIFTQPDTYINTGIYLFFGIVLGILAMIFPKNNITTVHKKRKKIKSKAKSIVQNRNSIAFFLTFVEILKLT